jgi:hypothetical protein
MFLHNRRQVGTHHRAEYFQGHREERYAPKVPHVMDITALLQRDDDRGV